MTAIQQQLLPPLEGAQELMQELSPHRLALDLDCLQRLLRGLRLSLALR